MSCPILSFFSCQSCLLSNLHLLKFKVSTKLCARVEISCHVWKRNMVNKGFKCKEMSTLKTDGDVFNMDPMSSTRCKSWARDALILSNRKLICTNY